MSLTKSVKSEVPVETFSKVIEAVYDCALDPTRWQDTLVLIAELCRSQTCILTVHDLANGRYDELAYKVGHTASWGDVLRHTAAVWMAEEGVPMSKIAQYLGHSNDKVTQKVYARYSPEFMKDAAAALQL